MIPGVQPGRRGEREREIMTMCGSKDEKIAERLGLICPMMALLLRGAVGSKLKYIRQ